MNLVVTLFRRDLRVFLRHRTAVLITVGAPVVLVTLFLLCGRGQLAQQVSVMLAADEAQANSAADAWIFATVVCLAVFTTGLAFVAGLIDDLRSGRFSLYYLSSVKPWQILAARFGAMAAVSFAVGLVVALIGQIWVLAGGGHTMSILGWLQLIGALLLVTVCFTAVSGFVASFRWSNLGFGAYVFFATVVVGFLTLSFALLNPGSKAAILGILPFAQAAALLRSPMVRPILGDQVGGSSTALDNLNISFGASLQAGDTSVWPGWLVVVILLLWTLALLALAVYRLERSVREAA